MRYYVKKDTCGLLAILGGLIAFAAALGAVGYAIYRRRQNTRLVREIDVMLDDEQPQTADDLCVCQEQNAAEAGTEEDLSALCEDEDEQ